MSGKGATRARVSRRRARATEAPASLAATARLHPVTPSYVYVYCECTRTCLATTSRFRHSVLSACSTLLPHLSIGAPGPIFFFAGSNSKGTIPFVPKYSLLNFLSQIQSLVLFKTVCKILFFLLWLALLIEALQKWFKFDDICAIF